MTGFFTDLSALPAPSGGAIVLFLVFTGILFSVGPPGAISCFLRFHMPLYFTRDLRWPYLSLFEERYGRKSNQRAPKPPFGFWLFIRGFGGETCVVYYEFARVQLTRFRPVRGVLRTASTDSVVLLQLRRIRWHLRNNQPNL